MSMLRWLGYEVESISSGEKAIEYLRKARDTFQEMGVDYWLRRTQKALVSLRA